MTANQMSTTPTPGTSTPILTPPTTTEMPPTPTPNTQWLIVKSMQPYTDNIAQCIANWWQKQDDSIAARVATYCQESAYTVIDLEAV